jgi:electron transfer flavoprotein beta subunit
MKIFVLVKQTPDTETSMKLSGTSINESGVKWIISPFDENAIEGALKIKEKVGGDTTITAVALGPDRVTESLRTAYAFGADRAVHIKDDVTSVIDVSYNASVLGNYLKTESPDIILAGHTAIDSQSSMVPGMISEILCCANINNANEITVENNTVRVKREIEGGSAVMKSPLPVVITAAKSLNTPRYPSLKGIMAAKKKQIETKSADEFSAGVPKIEIVSMELPPPRPPGRIIDGATSSEKAEKLVKALREEAKVI